MPENWTQEEIEVIVNEYFAMLAKEQAGIAFNKSEILNSILPSNPDHVGSSNQALPSYDKISGL